MSSENNFTQATQSTSCRIHDHLWGNHQAYSKNQLSDRSYLTKAPPSSHTIKLLPKTIFSSYILYCWKYLGWWYRDCGCWKHTEKNALCLESSSFDFTQKAALYTFLSVATQTKGSFMKYLRHREVFIILTWSAANQSLHAHQHTCSKCIKIIRLFHTDLLKSYMLYRLINCLRFIKSARMIYTANCILIHPNTHSIWLAFKLTLI